MSWLQKLLDTYEMCYGRESGHVAALMPISHTTQQAHIEIVIDSMGNFRSAMVCRKESRTTLIPCTERSGGRTGTKPFSHPLGDKLQYIAADFVAYGGQVTSGYAADPLEPHRDYIRQLAAWTGSAHGHPALEAIYRYVQRGEVVRDLIAAQILPSNEAGQIARQWTGDKDEAPELYKALAPGQLPGDAFVRWSIDTLTGTWEDPRLINAWIAYHETTQTRRGYCLAGGRETFLAAQHPAKLRHAADRAKLISSNDTAGFTFRGRFVEADEAASVGYEATHKAHNALRWLIAKQGSVRGSQAVLCWSVSDAMVPDPMTDTVGIGCVTGIDGDLEAGEVFSRQLKLAVDSYRTQSLDAHGVQIITLDSATDGRMSIRYYRELRGAEFLQRIEDWHRTLAWPQNFGKARKFIGAPAPRDIALAAFGNGINPRLEAATRERLLSCILDGSPVPQDLIDATRRRIVRRAEQDPWEWERDLGIVCSLFKGKHRERNYQMTLEPSRESRDYLYGRLLALVDHIESRALYIGGENRETNAMRLLQRFADRPSSTWRSLELHLTPYRSRLRKNPRTAPFLHDCENLLDEVICAFDPVQFCSDVPLSTEFLLAYHCQRALLRERRSITGSRESAAADPAVPA